MIRRVANLILERDRGGNVWAYQTEPTISHFSVAAVDVPAVAAAFAELARPELARPELGELVALRPVSIGPDAARVLEAAIKLCVANASFWGAQGNATLAVPWAELRDALIEARGRPASSPADEPAPPNLG